MMPSPVNPLLSVCIPTYNRAGWLRITLPLWVEQAKQCGSSVEIVVSDNASSDETPQVVEDAQKMEAMRYSRNATNIGGNPNFYKLVSELAQGEYVWVVGDDDFPIPGALERIIEAIQRNADLDFFYVPYRVGLVEGGPPVFTDISQFNLTPEKDWGEARRVAQIKELIGYDSNCFTPIYCSIFRRPLAVEAFEGSLHEEPFTTVRSVSSHALYIADNFLNKPTYFLGHSCLIVLTGSSWPHYYPIYWLKILPEIYDHFERKGADPHVMNQFRRGLLKAAVYPLFHITLRPKTPLRKDFSLWKFLWRYKKFKELWFSLLSIPIYVIYKNLPLSLQSRMHDAANKMKRIISK